MIRKTYRPQYFVLHAQEFFCKDIPFFCIIALNNRNIYRYFMRIFRLLIIFILVGLSIVGCTKKNDKAGKRDMMQFFDKEKVTILITDSGLGGMSVVADVSERLKEAGIFRKAQVIFFNAQPHASVGYNSMKKTKHKVRIFENALKAMDAKYHPDILLIACNTLSVLYDYTDFSKETEVPVFGIVDKGVELIKEKLADKKGRVIIFATKTTVKQNQHKKKLMDAGIEEGQIITRACPRLAGRIENDSHSDTTVTLIRKYVDEALAALPNEQETLYVSYNCTHYGYVDDIFRQTFREKGVQVQDFLDPNPRMADFIFNPDYMKRYPNSVVQVKVESQTQITDREVESIALLLRPRSPNTARALRAYSFVPHTFEWASVINEQ